MFGRLSEWYQSNSSKWGGALVTIVVVVVFLVISASLIFLLTQGVPYTMKYLTRFISEAKLGQWAVTAAFGIAGVTIIWIILRK